MSKRQHNITIEGFSNFLLQGAFLRAEGEWQLFLGPFSEAKLANNSNDLLFCPYFYDLASAEMLEPSSVVSLSCEELRRHCEIFLESNLSAKPQITEVDFVEPLESDFAISFKTILSKISNQEIDKAVPVVFSKAPDQMTSADKALLLQNLLDCPESLYPYGFWTETRGVMGATPELLFKIRDHELTTMALAGTCPKTEAATRDSLLSDEKEMYEHRLVVDDIVSRLQIWGEVQRGPTEVLELPTLFHLKTNISVLSSKALDIMELCQSLHPTPALGVSPRAYGYQWMQELPDQENRQFFGAPFVIKTGRDALCLVGIRNIQWNDSKCMIGSGCGIVSASEFQREWRELFHKRLSVKKILGLKV